MDQELEIELLQDEVSALQSQVIQLEKFKKRVEKAERYVQEKVTCVSWVEALLEVAGKMPDKEDFTILLEALKDDRVIIQPKGDTNGNSQTTTCNKQDCNCNSI